MQILQPGQGYTEVHTYTGAGEDLPNWANGTWYKGFSHREIPDTGVFKMSQLLPRSHGAQANEALFMLGAAGLSVAVLSRVLAR